MVLWQSPDTPVMSCFHVSARGFDCARAVRSLVCVPCFMLERGVRIPALMSWDSVFVSGFRHSRSVFCHCVSARSRVRSIARSHVHVCFVVLHAVRVSIGCMHSCNILCCVARRLCISLAACFHVVMSCVNMWLMSFLISCVFVSCFAHGWWIVCWPCACVSVLCEHVASVLFFCVPCALVSFVLTPPILLPVYWLIFPSCSPSLPSSFAPFIISLCLQFRLGLLPYVGSSMSCVQPCPALSSPVLSCPVLSCPVLSCPVLSCPVLSCPVLSCPALSCPALPCPACQSVFPLRGCFCLFYY